MYVMRVPEAFTRYSMSKTICQRYDLLRVVKEGNYVSQAVYTPRSCSWLPVYCGNTRSHRGLWTSVSRHSSESGRSHKDISSPRYGWAVGRGGVAITVTG